MSGLDDLRARLECAKLVEGIDVVGGSYRLQTRLLYPDGSNIDVFLSPGDKPPVMSDMGNTMTWLSHMNIKPWTTTRRREEVEAIVSSIGVVLDDGMIVSQVEGEEHESLAMIRVAQACSRIADLYLIKRRQTAPFREDVEEVINNFDVSYRVDLKLEGRSGVRVPVDMLVQGKTKESAVFCVEPISTSVDLTAHRLFELVGRKEQLVSIWNDRRSQLDKSATAFLSQYSLLLPFSARDQVRETLAA